MNNFEKNIFAMYGEQGQQWLNNLPTIVQQIANQWHLSDLHVVENLSYNYIMSGFQHERPIILKLGFNQQDFERESAALKVFLKCR